MIVEFVTKISAFHQAATIFEKHYAVIHFKRRHIHKEI